MPTYRVELSVSKRAGCQSTQCKKEKTLIEKGALRQGVQVQFQEHDSWKWRHWGCVTPRVLYNWKEIAGDDMEMVDGYEQLPPGAQAKVKEAFRVLHVADEDWNGDEACNRFDENKPNMGMFVKTPKGKKAKDDEDDDDESPTGKKPKKKAAPKKRGRAAVEDEEDEEDASPPPKKTRGKAKKAAPLEEDDDAEAAAPAKKGRAKKAASKKDADDAEAPEDAAPPAKKSRAKKTAPTVDTPAPDEDDAPAPKKGRGRRKKAAVEVLEDD